MHSLLESPGHQFKESPAHQRRAIGANVVDEQIETLITGKFVEAEVVAFLDPTTGAAFSLIPSTDQAPDTDGSFLIPRYREYFLYRNTPTSPSVVEGSNPSGAYPNNGINANPFGAEAIFGTPQLFNNDFTGANGAQLGWQWALAYGQLTYFHHRPPVFRDEAWYGRRSRVRTAYPTAAWMGTGLIVETPPGTWHLTTITLLERFYLTPYVWKEVPLSATTDVLTFLILAETPEEWIARTGVSIAGV